MDNETTGGAASVFSGEHPSETLVAVDRCICTFPRRASAPEIEKCLTSLARAILDHIQKPVEANPLEAIFGENISVQQKRFISACLLRILGVCETVFDTNPTLRPRIYGLFDDALASDLYPKHGIKADDLSHIKHSKLKEAGPTAEKALASVIDSLTNLDRLNRFRQDFMRTINKPENNLVLAPFMPPSLCSPGRIGELVSSLQSYLRAAPHELVEEYSEATEVLTEYAEEAEAYGTAYSREFLARMARVMEDLLHQRFTTSEAGRPAQLSVMAADRRYHLHEVGRQLELEFSVANRGRGPALQVLVQAQSEFENVALRRDEESLGTIDPGQSVTVVFPASVVAAESIAIVSLQVQWKNPDQSDNDNSAQFELVGQRPDIDWDTLEWEDPYSLEPVESHTNLVDRSEIVNQLMSQAKARSVGSAYIYGQKRVGKTSVAKALQSRLREEDRLGVVYLEGGEYVSAEAATTIDRLGRKLCEEVKKLDRRLDAIAVPEFSGDLSPLTSFLDQAEELLPQLRLIVILDEFDELPFELYRRGNLGDAFFLTLRAISGRKRCGILLVGGEKMKFIMSIQGQALNKFLPIQVDYFDRENHWEDFRQLVTNPTERWLEFTDEAIVELHKVTAGNPYYTMYVCREIWRQALRDRDSYISETKVRRATDSVLRALESNAFQHFWEDGIFEETGDRREEVSVRRRRLLLAMANVWRRKAKASKEDLEEEDVVSFGQDKLASDLRDFVQRDVLTETNGPYDSKVPLFRTWLEREGPRRILTTFTEPDKILERRRQEEEAYIRPEEIVELVDSWDLYQGQRVTEDQVRAWLEQFGENVDQRIMFKILQGLRFYSNDELRAKMREAHGIVVRGLQRLIVEDERRRRDILVSYLDSPAKSGGGRYAKLYKDENGIYYKNVVERGALAKTLRDNDRVQALVLIDDLLGTGNSAEGYFKQLAADCGDLLRQPHLAVYFVVVTGFEEAQDRVESVLKELQLPIETHILDPLDSSDKCFSENSKILPDRTERLRAEQLAREHGVALVKNYPLGYGDCQCAIVFSESCPNNSLPIFWAKSDDPKWRPLFRRPMARRQM